MIAEGAFPAYADKACFPRFLRLRPLLPGTINDTIVSFDPETYEEKDPHPNKGLTGNGFVLCHPATLEV